jgi:ApaG protein
MTNKFVSISNDYKITVTTAFDFNQSNPLQYNYLFKYTILIENQGSKKAQLLSRKWNIKNANGEINVVEGPGVIGHTPEFEPGGAFEYSSFCPLSTMTGEMWGHFHMVGEDGSSFQIETPRFKLEIPEEFIDIY